MFDPLSLPTSPNATFSPASACGPSRCASPGGPMIGRFGRDHALANLSPRQAQAKGLLTSGTYGPSGCTSSASAALGLSLANRLHPRSALLGSTLFRLTWKARTTPSGRMICALRASVRPISDSGFGGWPTPTASLADKGVRSVEGAIIEAMRSRGADLAAVSALASWPTPDTCQGGGRVSRDPLAKSRPSGAKRMFSINDAAQLASWATPAARDHKSDRSRLSSAELYGSKGQPLARQSLYAVSGGGADWIYCRDGKYRPVEPGSFPLADGSPARVGRLRAYGNAIKPWPAAEFITAFLDEMEAA